MKKTLLFFAALIISAPMFSQANNAIKIGIANLFMGEANIKYERAFNEQMSAQIGIGYIFPRDIVELANNRNLFETFDIKDDNGNFVDPTEIVLDDRIVNVTSLKTTGLRYHAEFRYYPGDSDPLKTFYIAPYVNYWQNRDNSATAVDDSGYNYEGELKMSYLGGGVQFGLQWLIADVFVIDWNFLGLGFGRAGLDASYSTDRPGEDFDGYNMSVVDFFENDINDADIPFFDPDYSVSNTDNSIEASLNQGTIMLRTGFSLGFAF